MAKFRKRPVVIEAIQVSVENVVEIGEFFGNGPSDREFGWHGDHWTILTLEGEMRADLGDWIIKGIADEFYPCKPDIFEQTYEAVTS